VTQTSWHLLSAQLQRESGLMELLLFKLQQEHLMLAAGQDRWLHHATAEVNLVMEELHQASATRTATALGLAASVGLPANATLGQLSQSAVISSPEWSAMLEDQRGQLRDLLRQIEHIGRINREILASRLSVTRDALVMLGGAPAVGYGRDAYSSRPVAHVVSEAF
jgi:FlgN protein